MAAALRYLNQRYSIPDKVIGLLTDIGTEEFAHLEMIATMIYKLTKDATPDQLKAAGLGDHYAIHDNALYYHNSAVVFLGPLPIFRLKGIQLQIYMKILPLKKRQEQPINGSLIYQMIQTLTTLFAF